MSALGFLENLTPLILMPFGAKLFVALNQKRPVTLALSRHGAKVPLIPAFRLVVTNASGNFFRSLYGPRGYASLVDEYEQSVENISHFFHPRHGLFGQIVSGKECCDTHRSNTVI